MTSKSTIQQLELWRPSAIDWKPHAYQKKAVKFLVEHGAAGLFLDPGLGKTSITLAAIKVLKKAKLLDRVLLIAPLRVAHSVWPREVEKWKDFQHLKVVVLHGPNKDELIKEPADIYVINPEGLDWLLDTTKSKTPTGKVRVEVNLKTRFNRLDVDTLVVDELTKFKHTTSGRFKSLKNVLGKFRRRWGLTGSPAANGLIDLFGQCYVLDQGRALGEYITRYKMQYFTPLDKMGFNWVPRENAEEEIYQRVAPLVLRMSAEDHLELPDLVENIIRLDLPEPVLRVYQKLEDDLVALIDDATVTAANAGVLSGKCRQAASGAIYKDKDLESLLLHGLPLPKGRDAFVEVHDAKVQALDELIEELQGQPLLVAYEFQHELERFKLKFGKDIPFIGGGVNAKRALEIERAWNHGELPLLFGHPQSMAHGLNLQQSGHHVCWFTTTWDFELYDQLIRRIWRQGSKAKRVFVHHLVARKTIDEVVLGTVRSKRRGQSAFFEALKSLGKKNRVNTLKLTG